MQMKYGGEGTGGQIRRLMYERCVRLIAVQGHVPLICPTWKTENIKLIGAFLAMHEMDY